MLKGAIADLYHYYDYYDDDDDHYYYHYYYEILVTPGLKTIYRYFVTRFT